MDPNLQQEAKVYLYCFTTAYNVDKIFNYCSYATFAGDDSGRVVIWNMAPIVKEQAEEDVNIPKLMCQMDNHLGKFFNHEILRYLKLIQFLLYSLCELC